MKKFIVFMSVLAVFISSVEARDYAKLQVKEMKHAQKYGSTQRYFNNMAETKVNQSVVPFTTISQIKDPKIMNFGLPEKVDEAKYKAKIKSDEAEYKKIAKMFGTRTIDNYNAQAKGEDYYKLYRIAEKIIRANNLDYQNWRIGIYRNATSPNAYSTNNYIAISTSMYDTFADNEDALAMVIGHEFGHALLGHSQRSCKTAKQLKDMADLVKIGNNLAAFPALYYKKKYLIDSKNMEYAADAEGLKLVAKAGFDTTNAMDVIAFLETLPHTNDISSDHPEPEKRKANLDQNRRLFIEEEWKEVGKYNIYNSDVLKVSQSSDRTSIYISGNSGRLNPEAYYRPETPAQIYARCAYKMYQGGQFGKSLEYFNELFKLDKSNAPAYLYASYASEALYKNTGKKNYLEDAKTYANSAKMLDPNNKYILEQIDSL